MKFFSIVAYVFLLFVFGDIQGHVSFNTRHRHPVHEGQLRLLQDHLQPITHVVVLEVANIVNCSMS